MSEWRLMEYGKNYIRMFQRFPEDSNKIWRLFVARDKKIYYQEHKSLRMLNASDWDQFPKLSEDMSRRVIQTVLECDTVNLEVDFE